jgi:DAK2 domain fusion protein YloV
MSEGLAGKRRFNGLDLAYALSQGTKTAYGAVTKPVEGTILTVIREATDAAVATAERDEDIEAVLRATVEGAEKSVARTPTLLAILREAGVVDSGGQGLYRLFQGALAHLTEGGRAAPRAPAATTTRARPSTLVAHADDGFGYETMFLLQATPAHPIDIDALRAHLESVGESVLVAGDSKAVKVHVHNDRPDLVIGHGLTLGALSKISVENLDNQARDVREARAESFTGLAAEATPPSTNGTGPALTANPAAAGVAPLGVVAVAAGDGLAAIFQEFGVAAIVRGGQSANPSTGELLEAIEGTDAAEVVVLPNNPNVVLAARQVASMTKKPVTVIPTRNAAEGFAALLCLDPAEGVDANVGPMTAAARSIQTLQVTEAVRDATIGSKKVKHGQTIALDPDEGLVAVSNDPMRCILDAVGRLTPGFELVTVFYGADAHLDEAEDVAKRIQQSLSGVDVELRHGGQPHYRYLISAE